MKKTFQLAIEGKNPDRILDAVKHEIRQYLRRERRRELPEGVDFLDFDCRFGLSSEAAEVVHLATLTGLIDAAARDAAPRVYLEILAKPGHRTKRPRPDDTARAEPSADALPDTAAAEAPAQEIP